MQAALVSINPLDTSDLRVKGAPIGTEYARTSPFQEYTVKRQYSGMTQPAYFDANTAAYLDTLSPKEHRITTEPGKAGFLVGAKESMLQAARNMP